MSAPDVVEWRRRIEKLPDTSRTWVIVSYLFPPAGGVGVQRALGFAKYLTQFGCRVSVVSASNPTHPARDQGLLRHVPASVRVLRAPTLEAPLWIKRLAQRWLAGAAAGARPKRAADARPGRAARLRALAQRSVNRVLFPDPQVMWNFTAARALARACQPDGSVTVLVSVPPFSSLLLVPRIKRRFPRVRVILDFRDEWLDWYLGHVHTLSAQFDVEAARRVEREVVELADFVLTVTPVQQRSLRTRYSDLAASKFLCVTNGYDPDAFAEFRARNAGNERIVVTYLGTVYKPCSPRGYLDALDSLPPEVRDRFETRFIGRVTPGEAPLLSGRKSRVCQLGFLQQADGFRRLEESDYLLLIVDDPGSHAGKLFEYLATRKPILALTPPAGEVARIIRETGAGWCADARDVGAIRELLLRAARAPRGEALGGNDAVREYERPRIVADFLRQVEFP